MKIAVAGGTGFVGSRITRALLDRGHEVSVLSRSREKVGSHPDLEGAAAIEADVTAAASLQGVFEGVEAVVGVVQLPNYPIEQARKGLTFDRYDREGTENLVTEARRAGVSRYLYMSGAGADVTSDKRWYRAKGLAEQAVRASGLRWAVVRPSWAYGPGDKALNRFLQIARYSPVVPQIGVRTQLVQPIHVDDVAWCVAEIFAREDTWDRDYEVGGPVMSMNEVISTMLKVMGWKRLIVPIPAPLVKAGSAPLLALPKPFMSPGGVEFATGDALVDTTTAREVLGFDPVPLADGLGRYLKR